jgi:hypothetical protein
MFNYTQGYQNHILDCTILKFYISKLTYDLTPLENPARMRSAIETSSSLKSRVYPHF